MKTMEISFALTRIAVQFVWCASAKDLIKEVKKAKIKITTQKNYPTVGCFFRDKVSYTDDPGVWFTRFNVCVSGRKTSLDTTRLMIHESVHAAHSLATHFVQSKKKAKRCPKDELICYAAQGIGALGLSWLAAGCPEELPESVWEDSLNGIAMCMDEDAW